MGLEHKSGALPHNSLWRKAKLGEDVIIAHLDSGWYMTSEIIKFKRNIFK